MTYSMTRKGTIINSGIGVHKCAKTRNVVLEYEVTISTNRVKFDSRGFMVDHEDIDTIVRSETEHSQLSCELMAFNIVKSLEKYFNLESKKERIDVPFISITIGEKDGDASFTIEQQINER